MSHFIGKTFVPRISPPMSYFPLPFSSYKTFFLHAFFPRWKIFSLLSPPMKLLFSRLPCKIFFPPSFSPLMNSFSFVLPPTRRRSEKVIFLPSFITLFHKLAPGHIFYRMLSVFSPHMMMYSQRYSESFMTPSVSLASQPLMYSQRHAPSS